MPKLIYPNATRLLDPTTPDDPRWHALRKTGVGASEAAPLMGEGYKGNNPFTVWEHKISDDEPQFNESTLKLFDRGHRLEPIAADLFAEQNPGIELQDEGLLRSTINPYMTCTPDRLTSDNGGLEIKTAGLFATKKFNPEIVPRLYYWQALQNLYVTGRGHWYIFALHPDSWNTWTWRLDADDPQVKADMELLSLTIIDFWESYVLTNTPPDFRITDSVTLNQVHANPVGAADLGDDEVNTLSAVINRYREVTKEIGELKKEKDSLSEILKLTAGEKDRVTYQDEFLYKYSSTTRDYVDVKRLKAEAPEIFKEYGETRTHRNLSFTPPKEGN